MGENIKSALEIAQEKLAKIGEPTEAERLRWKYLPEGEKIAAKYLNKNSNIAAELKNYDRKTTKYIKEGIAEVLVRNINLPKSDAERKNNKKAMDGLKAIKTDKVGVENVYSKLRNVFTHYAEQGEQQRKQAYQQLKTELGAKFQQALQQQMGTTADMKIDIEQQPQFQQEWLRLQSQLESQYTTVIEEYKRELLAIA